MEQRSSENTGHVFELTEENAIDSPVENIKWYGREDQTAEALMHDTGKGEPVVIRMIEFKFPPTIETLPTKDDILTPQYMKHLQTELWSDDLRLVMEPRVVIEKEGCKIFAPCKARTGVSFLEEPKLLQEWTR